MSDIAPGLLEKIQDEFNRLINEDATLRALHDKITYSVTPTYGMLTRLAGRYGELSSRALLSVLGDDVLPDGKMYFNIAEKTILPVLQQDYELIAEAVDDVQTAINDLAGVGLRAQIPAFNQDRADGIINRLTSEETFSDGSWLLGEPLENFCMSIVDEAAELNAEFWSNAGRKSYIKRTVAGGCCKWCAANAGVYIYPDVPPDVYKRHSACRCYVEFRSEAGTKDIHYGRQGQKTRPQEKLERLYALLDEIDAKAPKLTGAALENSLI